MEKGNHQANQDGGDEDILWLPVCQEWISGHTCHRPGNNSKTHNWANLAQNATLLYY